MEGSELSNDSAIFFVVSGFPFEFRFESKKMNKIKNLFALSLIAWFKVGASCGRTDAQCGGQVDNPRAHTCKNTVDCRRK